MFPEIVGLLSAGAFFCSVLDHVLGNNTKAYIQNHQLLWFCSLMGLPPVVFWGATLLARKLLPLNGRRETGAIE